MLNSLVDLVLPRQCLCCARPGAAVCAPCLAVAPLPVPGLNVAGWAAAPYDAVVRAALIRFKERGRTDLAPVLAQCLSAAVVRLRPVPGTRLVCVPSTPASRQVRGYDHVKLLAGRAGRHLRLRVAAPLRFTREVADSAGLGVAERSANLDGALRACPPPRPNCPAIVVDDIVTTGATARACVSALRAAGWDATGFAAVAATPRADTQPEPLARTRKAV